MLLALGLIGGFSDGAPEMVLEVSAELPDPNGAVRALQRLESRVEALLLAAVAVEVRGVGVEHDADGDAERRRDRGELGKIALAPDLHDGRALAVQIEPKTSRVLGKGELLGVALDEEHARGEEQLVPLRVQLLDQLLATLGIGRKLGGSGRRAVGAAPEKHDLVIIGDRDEVGRVRRVDDLVRPADFAERPVERPLHLRVEEHLRFLDQDDGALPAVPLEGPEDREDDGVLDALAELGRADREPALANPKFERLVEIHRLERGEEEIELVGVRRGIEAELSERVVLDRLLECFEVRRAQDREDLLHQLLEPFGPGLLHRGTVGTGHGDGALGIVKIAVDVLEQRAKQGVPRSREMFLEAPIRPDVHERNGLAHVARDPDDRLVLVRFTLLRSLPHDHHGAALGVAAFLFQAALALLRPDLVPRVPERDSMDLGRRSSLDLAVWHMGIERQRDLDVAGGVA